MVCDWKNALQRNTHRVDEPLCLHSATNSEEKTLHYIKSGQEISNQLEVIL